MAVARVAAISVRGLRATRTSSRAALGQRYEISAITEKLLKESHTLVQNRRGWRGWRQLSVVRIVKETGDCASFYLKDPDNQPLPPFLPGQFITVGIKDSKGKLVSRCYSLSAAPDSRYYRITVKRVPGGKVSNFLHDQIKVGHELLVGAPAGNFVVTPGTTSPLVLIAAGIGITPIVSIIKFAEELQPDREIHVFYQVRDLENAPLLREIAKWASGHPSVRLYLYVSRPGEHVPSWVFGVGRLNAEEILRVYGSTKGQFMFCGPVPMLQSIKKGLLAGGVDSAGITVEAFEAIQKSKRAEDANANTGVGDSASNVKVRFAKSCKDGASDAINSTLLEVGEAVGVELESGCRGGDCGACIVKLIKGSVRYASKPSFGPLEADEALACVAIPVDPVVVDA